MEDKKKTHGITVYKPALRRTTIKQSGERGWWSEGLRVEAVSLWLKTGSLPTVAHTLKIPYNTIRSWRTKPFWEEIVAQLRSEEDGEMDTKYSKLMKKSLEQIEDRLENGDFMYDPKTGKMKRKPVLLRDALRASKELSEQRTLVRKKPKEQQTNENVVSRLDKLAAELMSFAKAKKAVIDIIDVEAS